MSYKSFCLLRLEVSSECITHSDDNISFCMKNIFKFWLAYEALVPSRGSKPATVKYSWTVCKIDFNDPFPWEGEGAAQKDGYVLQCAIFDANKLMDILK